MTGLPCRSNRKRSYAPCSCVRLPFAVPSRTLIAVASMAGMMPSFWRRDPRESPLSRHFSQSFRDASRKKPREFSSDSKRMAQFDVVGAPRLELGTPCSQSRCATTAPRPDDF